MRHRNAGYKLGRNTSHRRALLRNLVTSILLEDRVVTTVTKAKAARPHVEKLITWASVAMCMPAVRHWPI
jgi:large subunit ribosomal protein L17